MSAPSPRTFVYAVLLPHPTEHRVLVQRDGDGWVLPHWKTTERHFWAAADYVNRTVRERLGVEVTTLRCLPHDPEPADGPIRRTYDLENHSPHWQPPADARWAGLDDLDRLRLIIPEHRDALARGFADAASDTIPPQRVPWARRGWFAEAVGWIRAQISGLGLQPAGPVEQERVWSISCILRAPTSTGDLYLKASPGFFTAEPVITRYLARRFPAHISELVAVEEGQSWLLMRDFGRTRLDHIPEISWWEEAVRLMARLQLACVDRVNEMLAVGFLDRRLPVLAGQVEPLLSYVVSTGRTARGALNDAELETLVGGAPRLRAMCADLAAVPIPATLEHGDYHAGNVVLQRDHLLIYDWSDGCVAHPFFALLPFLTFRSEQLPGGPEAHARLIRGYLEAWTDFAPMDRLQKAFELSQTLAALHQAVSYYRILTGVEPDALWEWETDLPYFLRMVVSRLNQQGEI